MTINYTTNLSLAEPVTGTESGTWGDDVNKGLTDYLDISIAGTLALTSASFTANALTLANTTGSSSSNGITTTTAQYYILKLSSLAAAVTITAPSSSKTYLVYNSDSTYSATIKASGQSGVSVIAGERALVFFNGTDYVKASSTVQTYPGAGIANSTGSAWGTSYSTTGSGTVVALATSPSFTTPVLGTPTSGNLSNCTADGTNGVGFLNIPINSQSAAYTLVLADAGKAILHPSTDANARTFTIPANSSVAYPVGTAISFINMTSNVVTIAITTDTMYLSSAGTTGSRSLAQYGSATAIKMTSTTWLISGSGLT